MPGSYPIITSFQRICATGSQEEYIDYHEDELLDPEQFNVWLMQHLLWHNTERPHWSLKMKPPVQFIQDNFSHPECPYVCSGYRPLTDNFGGCYIYD